MVQRITKIEQLDGLSVKDAQRMPHPADLARWNRDGLYGIDADRGVFVIFGAHEESNLLREADVKSLMRSLGFSREEAESVADQVDADSGLSP